MAVMLPLPMSSKLGPALRTWRALRRIKQSHAAELFGVSQATISRWEAGRQAPSPRECARLRELMSAAPSGAADAALLDLVRGSATPVHLICDFTHRLLAASSARARPWRMAPEKLYGASLWRYASEEIHQAEGKLEDLGWFEPEAMPIEVTTRGNESTDVPIHPSRIRWTRLRLSDGSYARLVETIG
jgi:transcriptional regulator with XRE-family HTH domain